MASGWAHFRKVWLKPEVYPLLGAMAAALGVMSAALINKARTPTVAWNKSKRTTGEILEDVEEVVPLWNTAKKNSTAIFSADSGIQDAKRIITEDLGTFVVKTAEEEQEEPEEEQSVAQEEALVETSAVVDDPPAVVQPAYDVMDETVEAINAAVDAAIETAKTITPEVASEQPVVEEPPAQQPPAASSPIEQSEPAQS